MEGLKVPAIDPPADEGGPSLQGGEDRGGGGGDLPLSDPGQEGPVRRPVGDQQAIQERSSRFVQHGGEPLRRLTLGAAAGGDDHPLQDGNPGPHDLLGGELLGVPIATEKKTTIFTGTHVQ